MKLIRALLVFSVLSIFLSAEDAPEDAHGSLQTMMKSELFTHIDNAYKSDHFKAAHWGELALSSTTYAQTGWVFQSFFVNANGAADTACTSVTSIIGYRVNHCVPMTTYSVKFQLTTGHTCSRGVIQYFSDNACRILVGSSSLEVAANKLCHRAQTPHYANLNAYQMIRCTTYNTPIPPAFPDLGITTELFPNKHCTDAPLEYTSLAAGKCIDMGGYYVSYDCTNDRPGYYRYGSNTCTGQRLGYKRMNTGCMYSDDNRDDDYTPAFLTPPVPSVSTTPFPTSAFKHPYQNTNNVFCTARAPTSGPASVPTAYPTSRGLRSVQFDIEQRIYGLDLATFVRSDLTRTTLLTTIANTMVGVTVNNIRDLYVVDVKVYVAKYRRLRSSNGDEGGSVESFSTGNRDIDSGSDNSESNAGPTSLANTLHSLATSVHNAVHDTVSSLYNMRLLETTNPANNIILATYTINTTTTLSAEQLYSQLYTAVSSGAFNTDLYTNANSAGASDLVGATSLSVNYPCVSDCEETHFEWVWWYIVVTAVGGFLLVVLLLLSAMLCYRKCTEDDCWVEEQEYDQIGIPDDDRILVF